MSGTTVNETITIPVPVGPEGPVGAAGATINGAALAGNVLSFLNGTTALCSVDLTPIVTAITAAVAAQLATPTPTPATATLTNIAVAPDGQTTMLVFSRAVTLPKPGDIAATINGIACGLSIATTDAATSATTHTYKLSTVACAGQTVLVTVQNTAFSSPALANTTAPAVANHSTQAAPVGAPAATGQVVTGDSTLGTLVVTTAPVTPADGFTAPGIYGPDTIYGDLSCGSGSSFGNYFVRGLCGARFSLGGMDGALFSLAGANGSQVNSGGLSYGVQKSTFDITINATDGVTTLSKAVTLQARANSLQLDNWIVLDGSTNHLNPNGGAGPAPNALYIGCPAGYGVADAVASCASPDGMIQSGGGYVWTTEAANPISAHHGEHDATLTDTAGYSYPCRFFFIQEMPPTARYNQAGKAGILYTNTPSSTVLGVVTAYSDAGLTSASFSMTSTGNCLTINGAGEVQPNPNATIPAGLIACTVTITSVTGLQTSLAFEIEALAGETLAPSSMTMTVATNLTNYIQNANTTPRAVGTPTVSGMTGTIVWSMTQDHVSTADADPNPATNPWGLQHDRYVINPATGAVTAQAQLSAWDGATGTDTITITITATNGPQTCTQTFEVPVTAVVGPVIFVGEGMSNPASAAYLAAVAQFGKPLAGYEHLTGDGSNTPATGGVLNNFINQNSQPTMTYAGATIYVFPNADPNYYANDNGSLPGSMESRWGLAGPFKLIGVVQTVNGVANCMPRLGGTVGSASGGTDQAGKGFLSLGDGDYDFKNLEISWVHANGWQGESAPESEQTGCGLRVNSNSRYCMRMDGLYVHDCDQGLQMGFGPGEVTLTNSELVNNGGVYVGAGATHNAYIDEIWKFTAANVLTHRTINGHCLKNRAQNSILTKIRAYDGERGAASNQIDFANGGIHALSDSVIQKGPFAQNPNSVSFCEDMQGDDFPVNSLTVSGTTFINDTPVNLLGGAIFMQSRVSTQSGEVLVRHVGRQQLLRIPGGEPADHGRNTDGPRCGVPNAPAPLATETGAILLTTQPPLDYSHPFAGLGNAIRVGSHYCPYDGENRNNFINTSGVQVDPGNDDIHIPASTAIGTVILPKMTAAGGYYFTLNAAQPDANLVMGTPGTKWSLAATASAYALGPYTLAPAGRYTVSTQADGSATVEVTGALQGGVDLIAVVAMAPNGMIAQNLVYIVVDPA